MPITSFSLGKVKPETGTPWVSYAQSAFCFPVMCAFLLVAVVFEFCVKQFAEPDIWWHLRNARNLVEYHSFSAVDKYSFTAAGSPWVNIEWLSELPYYVAFKALGLQGLLVISFAALVLIYVGIYYRCCCSGSDCKNAVIATLLAIFLGTISIGPRLLLFGWLCMVCLLLVLDHFRETGRALWLLPPLFALWINLHASWVFGMVVLGLTIVAGLFEGEWGLVVAQRFSPTELRKLATMAGVSVAALLVNPFGYKLLLYPFEFLFHQQGNVQYVEEWQPVNFSQGSGRLTLAVIFLTVGAALFSRRRWRLDELLLVVFALWAALSHVRFLFFLGLVLAPILAQRINLFPPYQRALDKPRLNAVIIGIIIVSIVLFFPSKAELRQKVDAMFPRAALQFMEDQHINGRIFNQYVWGGYMEWHAPEYKTFIDGRADIFVYNGVLDDHRKTTTIQKPLETLDKYRIQYVLLESKSPLAYLLDHTSMWSTIYQDNIAVLFKRAEPQGPTSATSE